MFLERHFVARCTDRRLGSERLRFPLVLPGGERIDTERRRAPERRDDARLSGLELFSEVPAAVIESLLETCPIREFTYDTLVLSPEERNEKISLVLAGKLRVHLDEVDSPNYISIKTGSCIGELSLIDGKPVTAFVIAEAGCHLLQIEEHHFWSSVLPHPGVARNLMRVLAERMRRNNESILEGLQQQLRLEHIQRELQLAREIQAGMLPMQSSIASEAEGIEIFAAMAPAREVGGDLYDYFALADGNFCFVIGDVSDKGVPAALFMARTVDAVRIVSRLLRNDVGGAGTLEKIIECVNHELSQNNASCMFVTMFFGVLDPERGMLHYCNAGHNNPYLIGGSGKLREINTAKGRPIGIAGDSVYASHSIAMEKQEMLFMFSDGITEAAALDGSFFGEARLERVLAASGGRPAQEVVDTVLAAVKKFAVGAAPSDDITALAVRLKPVTSGD